MEVQFAAERLERMIKPMFDVLVANPPEGVKQIQEHHICNGEDIGKQIMRTGQYVRHYNHENLHASLLTLFHFSRNSKLFVGSTIQQVNRDHLPNVSCPQYEGVIRNMRTCNAP